MPVVTIKATRFTTTGFSTRHTNGNSDRRRLHCFVDARSRTTPMTAWWSAIIADWYECDVLLQNSRCIRCRSDVAKNASHVVICDHAALRMRRLTQHVVRRFSLSYTFKQNKFYHIRCLSKSEKDSAQAKGHVQGHRFECSECTKK